MVNSFHPPKVFFGCFRQDFVGYGARTAPSSTCGNISKNPLRVNGSKSKHSLREYIEVQEDNSVFHFSIIQTIAYK